MTRQTERLENKVEWLRQKALRLDTQIKNQETKLRTAQEKEVVRTLPKVGEFVYVPETEKNHCGFLEGDVIISAGGLAKVVCTNPKEYRNVTIAFRGDIHEYREFMKRYNFGHLLEQQEELKTKYGNNQARVDENYYDEAKHYNKMVDLLDW